MILTCPSCGTQYVVKDGTIPPEGRQVRCAACKHSWHQDPESGTAAAAVPGAAEQAGPSSGPGDDAGDGDESLAEAALIDPRSGPEAEERAYEEAVIDGQVEPEAADPVEQTAQPAADWDAPPEAEPEPDTFSPFAGEDEEAPRRGGGLTKLLI